MPLSNLRKIVSFACFVICFTQFAFAVDVTQAKFNPMVKFRSGEKSDQLKWLITETGGLLDGPFQGPMAFVTDKNGNFWVGDTLNARILAFDGKGRPRKEIDLMVTGKTLDLASDPVLLDLIPGINGKLLVADAANNAILEVDVRGGKPRVFRSSNSGRGFWSQINRIHCDKKGRIFVEDLPLMKTIVLGPDGKPEKEALEGEVGIAVDSKGKTAMVVMDTMSQNVRHIVVAPKAGNPPEKIASLKFKEPIMWASLIGFDSSDKLYVIFDTDAIRHYVVLDPKGAIVSHRIVDFPDPNYDPGRPDWIGPDGTIYSVKIESERLQLMKLE